MYVCWSMTLSMHLIKHISELDVRLICIYLRETHAHAQSKADPHEVVRKMAARGRKRTNMGKGRREGAT